MASARYRCSLASKQDLSSVGTSCPPMVFGSCKSVPMPFSTAMQICPRSSGSRQVPRSRSRAAMGAVCLPGQLFFVISSYITSVNDAAGRLP
jgi:hypothetical protein